MIRVITATLLCFLGFFISAQPANDEICNAEALNPDGSCVTGTTVGATPDLDDPGCAGAQGASVWYAVTISENNDTLHIDINNIDVPGQMIAGVNVYTFDPDCNGTPTQFPGADYCGDVDGADLTLNDVVPGTIYFIQVLTPLFETGDFEICVEEAGPLLCISTSTCEDPELLEFMLPGLGVCITGCMAGADPGPTSSPDSCFNMPNETVWYEIFLPPIIPPSSLPSQATIIVTTTSDEPFPIDPHLAVFQNCENLDQVACDYGEFSHALGGGPGIPVVFYSTASVTFPVQDYPPENFIIAVSYLGVKDPEEFELCISLGTLCNEDSEIEVASTSLGSALNGPYAPSEEVEVCLRINDWNSGDNSTGCNFLHGIVPEFGDCWDPVSFDDEGQPSNITVPLTNNTGFGQWVWFEEGAVSYNFNAVPGYLPPNSLVGSGWFYIRNPGDNPNCPFDTNPNCTRGDGFFCEDEINVGWDVCFILTTKAFPECETEENTVCDISFRTFGDGETGGYSQVGCIYDQAWEIDLELECCEQPFFEPIISQFNCSEVEVIIELQSNLDPDVEYVWDVSPNSAGATACLDDCPNTIQQTLVNNTEDPISVTYIITPTTISEVCVGAPFEVDVTINPELSAEIPPSPTICEGSCVQLNASVDGGTPPYFYNWDTLGLGFFKVVCPMAPTPYGVTITDANGCTTTASTMVITTPNLSIAISNNPNTNTICRNDPDYPIELTADILAGGSGFYLYQWNNGVNAETIEAPETGTYCVTVSDNMTQCTGRICTNVTVNEPPEPMIEDPGILCDASPQICLTAEPEDGEWLSDTIPINQNGCINPSVIGPGDYEVCYSYTDPETMCDSTTCIEIQILAAPIFDDFNDTLVCDRFILPVITGENLSGTAAYFTEPGGQGTMYNPGNEITNSSRIYIFENIGDGVCITEDSFDITINLTPNAIFDALTPICIGDTAIISYTGNASAFASYSWDFGNAIFVNGSSSGPYQVLWDVVGSHDVSLIVNDQNCESEQNIETVFIEQVLSPPVVNCITTTTSIEFSWNDVPSASGYAVNLISGSAGVLMGNTYLVTGLNPMDEVVIEVVALSDGVCGNSSTIVTCNAIDCPVITLDILPVVDICLTGNSPAIELEVEILGSDGSGMGNWTGLFTTMDGFFDPEAAGPGTYLIGFNFNEVACFYSNSIEINVYESPSSMFTVNSEICQEDNAMILYQGNASLSATYNWDFDGGMVINGTGGMGPGPHEVEWTVSGTKVISLTVAENNCSSNIQFENIDVIPALIQPIINCSATTEEIIFSWDEVFGNSGYLINLINGQQGTIVGNTYTVSGLDPEVGVTIQLEVLSAGPCPNISSLETECFTLACALPNFSIVSPSDSLCIEESPAIIDLDVVFNPNNPIGSGSWSGPGITNQDEGLFDPLSAGLGQHIISFEYAELNCTEAVSTSIEIFEIPEASFTTQDTICLTELANISFTGPNSNGNFVWSFDNGMIQSGMDEGPYVVSWNSPGNKLIQLVLQRNGCESELVSIPIFVEDTLGMLDIDCEENYEDVVFSWNDLPGVNEYEIYIDGQLDGTQSNTNYTATGLNPGQMVEIQIVGINAGRCFNKSQSEICFASNCPPIDIEINPGDTSLCLDAQVNIIDLDSIITGGLGGENGIGTWTGPGINASNGEFDPNLAGVGNHQIMFLYDELDCIAEAEITIEVLAQPLSDFSIDQIICVEDTAVINFLGTNMGFASFDWMLQGGNIQQLNASTFQAWWDTPGLYDVGLLISENGCRSQLSSQQIIVEPSLEIPQIDCSTTTESINFSWDDVDCASSYEVYIDTGNGFEFVTTQIGTDFDLNNLAPEQEVSIQIVALSECSCPSVNNFNSCTASACPPVLIDIDEIGSFCISEVPSQIPINVSVQGGSGNGVEDWSGPGVDAQGVFDPIIAGIGDHQITYTYSEANCSFEENINIELFDEPNALFELFPPQCFGDKNGSIAINASGGDGNYSYYLDGSLLTSEIAEGLTPGQYEITVLDGNNCEYMEILNIDQPLNPSVDILGPGFVFIGNSGLLELSSNIPLDNIDNIVWEENGTLLCDGCQEVEVSPEISSTYCVTIDYDEFCSINNCVDLRVQIDTKFYVPSVFSPNEDGINDYFTLYTNNAATIANIRIFDRWGELVFKAVDIPTDMESEGWNGSFGQEQLNPGVYVFVAELRFSESVVEKVVGDITLIR